MENKYTVLCFYYDENMKRECNIEWGGEVYFSDKKKAMHYHRILAEAIKLGIDSVPDYVKVVEVVVAEKKNEFYESLSKIEVKL